MGGRYFVTGVQLGLLMSYLKHDEYDEALKLLERVYEEQFIGNRSDLVKFLELVHGISEEKTEFDRKK